MPQLNKIFDQFNEMYGLETKDLEHNLDGMTEVVGGEYDEWTDEIADSLIGIKGEPNRFIPEPANFVKEGLDVIYAMSQQLRERGVDLDAGLAELHRSNMSKTVEMNDLQEEIEIAKERYPDITTVALSDNRYVLKCAISGKVIKPTRYSPAEITPAIIKMPK